MNKKAMRMSCNGCRVLRKGCSDDCNIRPCLQWIKSPNAQANATMFLAKFYGRAGLINLINAGPDHLRPAIFRSLLYEACGRIINPIYGSVGLLWSGSWSQCQSAVEAVLRGSSQFMQVPTVDSPGGNNLICPTSTAYDIRHVRKSSIMSSSSDLHKVRTRPRFKRSKSDWESDGSEYESSKWIYPRPIYEETSHESWAAQPVKGDHSTDQEYESIFSAETIEGGWMANQDRILKFHTPKPHHEIDGCGHFSTDSNSNTPNLGTTLDHIGLELTLSVTTS